MLVLFTDCWGSNLSIQAGVGNLNGYLLQPSGIRYEVWSFSVSHLISIAYWKWLIFGVKLSIVVPQAIGISLRNEFNSKSWQVLKDRDTSTSERLDFSGGGRHSSWWSILGKCQVCFAVHKGHLSHDSVYRYIYAGNGEVYEQMDSMLVLFAECWGSNLSIQDGVGKLNGDLHQPSRIRYELRSFTVIYLISIAYWKGLISGVKLSIVVPQAIGISLRNRIGDSTGEFLVVVLSTFNEFEFLFLSCFCVGSGGMFSR